MSLSLVALAALDLAYVAALPSGGSGGTRGGSGSGGTRGGSGSSGSGGSGSGSSSGSRGGSGWTSSRNNGQRSNTGPLSKGAKIALAVIGGIVVLIIASILICNYVEKMKKRRKQHSAPSEKAESSRSSSRSSIRQGGDMSHNPGHTQAAVHHVSRPITASELTSAVMAGEGSKAGHGREGADDGSRGGAAAIVWEARALAVVSKGMSNGNHPHAPSGEAIAQPPTTNMPVPVPT
ncbi:hypothetical protein FRC07_004774 [Ceratobasidium sp. 392]|nr:hypothetical protein FRC07_004774 [Ceratobasidium sp. 392]